MAVAAAVLAALCISLIIFHLHNLQDSSRGEPVRAEEARGTLCHQGGRFISFTRDGELIAVDPVAERHQLWRIHGS